jgi:hypothetical protein
LPDAGIETMHMIRKGQRMLQGCIKLSFADQFYALAGKSVPFEELASVTTPTTFINWQRDRTPADLLTACRCA